MTLLVTGGRDLADGGLVFAALDVVHCRRPVTLLRHGACSGADAFAAEWAHGRGVPVDPCPADWARYGASAGPRRNEAMLAREPRLDGVVAFPGDRGTADCVREARSAGVKVQVVRARVGERECPSRS